VASFLRYAKISMHRLVTNTIRLIRGDPSNDVQRWVFGVLAACVVAALGFAEHDGRSGETYVTAPIQRGSIRTLVKATGTVNPVVMVDVGSQLSGQISEVLVDFNDLVKANQVIARIDQGPYITAVNGAKADLNIAKATAQLQKAALEKAKIAIDNARTSHEMAQAQLSAAQAQQDENERNFGRFQLLIKQNSASDRDFTQSRAVRDAGLANLRALDAQVRISDDATKTAEAELSMAEATYESSEAVVEQKQAALERTQVDLQWTEIRSPIDGMVIKRLINPGQTVAVSLEAKTLFKIANDLREMQVFGKIDEADVGQVKDGQPVSFTVDAYPDRLFSGRVVQVRKSPEVNQNVVTYTVVASAPNPDHLLYPGMTARLEVLVDENKDVLKIPNEALHFRPTGVEQGGAEAEGLDEKSTVWVLSARGEPSPVRITIGKSDESGTQLVSGNLMDGERVIVGLTHPAR
jgi:HlyD family secretion protein